MPSDERLPRSGTSANRVEAPGDESPRPRAPSRPREGFGGGTRASERFSSGGSRPSRGHERFSSETRSARASAGSRRSNDTADASDFADADAGARHSNFDQEYHQVRYHDECYLCPVGGAFAAMREIRPDVVDRVASAATELAGAARTFVESLAAEGRRRAPDPLQKIRIE